MRANRITAKPVQSSTADAGATPSFADVLLPPVRAVSDAADRAVLRDQLRHCFDVMPLLLLAHLACGLGLTVIAAIAGMSLAEPLAGTFVLSALAAIGWVIARAKARSTVSLEFAARALLGLAVAEIVGVALLLESAGARGAVGTGILIALIAIQGAVLLPVPLAFLVGIACQAALLALLGAPVEAIIAVAIGLAGGAPASLLRARASLGRARREQAAEHYTQRALRLLAEFEDHGRAWFWETDSDGRLTYVSPQLPRSIGREAGQVLGRPLTDLIVLDRTEALEPDMASRTIGFHLSARVAFREMEVRANAVEEVRWALTGRPIFDEFGRYLGFRGLGTDLTEIRRSEAEVSKLARYDSLTGLSNRVMIRQTLNDALREKGGRRGPCALFLLDLDRFKNVNDTLGHPVGDVLLKQVAERIVAVVGNHGQVGRLGGDEFQVVLPLIDDRRLLADLADRVIERLSIAYFIEGSNVSIGASVGIAVAPEDGVDGDALIRNADLALYAAKAAGKGVHRFYEESMHADAHERQMLELDLRGALANDQLMVHYQPIVSAASGETVGFEALVRWKHPVRGMVSPAIFVPVAEEIGLVQQIGEWVLRTACGEAAGWPEHIRVAVNISPLQFASPNLPALVVNTLASTGLPAHRLELEITEGVFLQNSDATEAMFEKLAAIGVRLALDDFGTGYSSLGYLQRAPFNKIKIDQSFVRGASIPGSRNAAIIKAIVSLADSLGMVTTAEGAETHDELALIRSLGCTQIQGYIFGRPMPAEEATALVGRVGKIAPEGFAASRAPRIAVLRSGTLHVGGRTFPIRLRNISSSGAMAELDGREMPKGPVEIQLTDGERIAAHVRWAGTGRFGVQFDAPYDMARVNTGRAEPRVRDNLSIAS